jgi:hypothetical protein
MSKRSVDVDPRPLNLDRKSFLIAGLLAVLISVALASLLFR